MKKILKVLLCTAIFLNLCTSCNNSAPDPFAPILQRSSPLPVKDNALESYGDKLNNTKHSAKKYSPINYDEQRSVWISYIDLQPMLLDKTKEQFTSNISSAFDDIKNIGCNTVYVHVRSFGDAYYDSEIFPASKDITGTIDENPDFDPLTVMISQAHSKGLSFHAWINPMRCETPNNMELINDKYSIKQWYNDPESYKDYIVYSSNDDHYWLDPAVLQVRELICSGVKEIAENYDVDGIHIDDYFYPTTDTSFDAGIYVKTGEKRPLDDWRRDNISQMVSRMYETVKSVDENILFGVSPQGNMENNYSKMYADVEEWCSKTGYLDYIVPQIYFGFENTIKPFEQTSDEWSSIVTCDKVKLVIGLGIYKISEDDEFADTAGIIGKQIETAKSLGNYSGVAFYNYNNMFKPQPDLVRRTNTELKYIEKAINNKK